MIIVSLVCLVLVIASCAVCLFVFPKAFGLLHQIGMAGLVIGCWARVDELLEGKTGEWVWIAHLGLAAFVWASNCEALRKHRTALPWDGILIRWGIKH